MRRVCFCWDSTRLLLGEGGDGRADNNLSTIVLRVSGVRKGESRINDRVKERAEDCEEMNNINTRGCGGTCGLLVVNRAGARTR